MVCCLWIFIKDLAMQSHYDITNITVFEKTIAF